MIEPARPEGVFPILWFAPSSNLHPDDAIDFAVELVLLTGTTHVSQLLISLNAIAASNITRRPCSELGSDISEKANDLWLEVSVSSHNRLDSVI